MTIKRNFLFFLMLVAVASIARSGIVSAVSVEAHELSSRVLVYEGEGGASCSHFLGNVLSWERRGGDWRDANGKPFGNQPYAVTKPGPQNTVWDVSKMVREQVSVGAQFGGFFLRPVGGSGYAHFHSREAAGVADWPMLVLEYADGRRDILKPTADTNLDCSTYQSLGHSPTLMVSGGHNTLMQFKFPLRLKADEVARARLILSSAKMGGALDIGVFAIAAPAFPTVPVSLGLAAEYPADRGIERSKDVIFAAGFEEGGGWKSRWAKGASGGIDVVADDGPFGFKPLDGSALRVNLKKGANLGSDLRLYLKDHGGEPEELYFRYYLRLAEDWNPAIADGKLPGMAGTYNNAGWGGRRVDGSDGWSLRGLFVRMFQKDHPMSGLTQLGTYAYHAEMTGTYGDFWIWPGALLARNRWYCIEQYVRLNRPGVSDGVMRVWVDGRLAMERSNMRLRNVDRLRIETVWLDVYHGGAETSPYDQHLYIDNVVVARRYIGPMTAPAGNAGGVVSK